MLIRGALAAVVGLVLLVIVPVMVLQDLMPGGNGSGGDEPAAIGTGGGVPAQFVAMYQAAARAYKVSPFALAALHKTETGYSSNPNTFKHNSAGAIGPMQFLDSTFATPTYGNAYKKIDDERPAYQQIDCSKGSPCAATVCLAGDACGTVHMCADHPCITDDFDAIAAAAAYLHSLGAGPVLDDATYRAFVSYKGGTPAAIPYAREAYKVAQDLAAANTTSLGMPFEVPDAPLYTRIIDLANEIDAERIPYCWGGGHGSTPARPSRGQPWCIDAHGQRYSYSTDVGLDCSGAVSMLLQLAGLKLPTLDSTHFMSWGEPGAGKYVTIFANIKHVFLQIARPDPQHAGAFVNTDWGTSSSRLPYNYAGWGAQGRVGDFVMRHPPGL